MQRLVWLRLGTAFLFSSSLSPGEHINNGGCLQSVSASESYRAVSFPVRPFSIHPTCFDNALRTKGSKMSDNDKIMAELKRDNEEKEKRFRELSEMVNTFTPAEQKEVKLLPKDKQEERIFSIWVSKITPTELRELIEKCPKSEQLEIFNLPDKDREEELNKMQNELTNKPSSTINNIKDLRKVSRYGLRNIVTTIYLKNNNLEFCWTNISKEGVFELSKSVLPYCQKLTYLNLSGNRGIGDEGAAAVASALSSNQCFKESLTKLNLCGDEISAKGAKAIALALESLTSLTELDLSDNDIGDKGAKAIAGSLPSLTKLNKLFINGNTIEYEGAKAIAGALPSLTNLTELDLSDNDIGDKGAKAIAGALPSLTELTRLHLGNNTIRDEGAKAIAVALPSLKKLTILGLDNNFKITQKGVKAVTDAVPAECKGELTTFWIC